MAVGTPDLPFGVGPLCWFPAWFRVDKASDGIFADWGAGSPGLPLNMGTFGSDGPDLLVSFRVLSIFRGIEIGTPGLFPGLFTGHSGVRGNVLLFLDCLNCPREL